MGGNRELGVLRREAIYLWYYFSIQFRQIFFYWVLGMKNFILYILFVAAVACLTGIVVNMLTFAV